MGECYANPRELANMILHHEVAVLHDYFFIVGAQKNLIFAFRRAFWNHTTMQGKFIITL